MTKRKITYSDQARKDLEDSFVCPRCRGIYYSSNQKPGEERIYCCKGDPGQRRCGWEGTKAEWMKAKTSKDR